GMRETDTAGGMDNRHKQASTDKLCETLAKPTQSFTSSSNNVGISHLIADMNGMSAAAQFASSTSHAQTHQSHARDTAAIVVDANDASDANSLSGSSVVTRCESQPPMHFSSIAYVNATRQTQQKMLLERETEFYLNQP